MSCNNIGTLCDKYGFNRLIHLRTIYGSLPASLPVVATNQALSSALSIDLNQVQALLDDVHAGAPAILERSYPQQQVYFLCPPVLTCLFECTYDAPSRHGEARELVAHRNAAKLSSWLISYPGGQSSAKTKVEVYDLNRTVSPGYEYTLRCTKCRARYGYAMYFNPSTKTQHFYDTQRELLCVKRSVFWTRTVASLLINNILHSHTTFEGFAETLRTTFGWSSRFGRKMVSNAFYAHEIEDELRTNGFQFGFSSEKTNCMEVKRHIEQLRLSRLYQHDCGIEGIARGCKFLTVMDGVWKIGFRHCHMQMKRTVDAKYVNLPQICENQPANGLLYCTEHITAAKRRNLPLTKKELRADDSSESATINDKDSALENEFTEMFEEEEITTAFKGENTSGDANTNGISDEGATCLKGLVGAPWCKKNLGKQKKTGSWSRGYFVFVNGCGHISDFRALYQSESMSQVFLIVMEWLQKRLHEIPLGEWDQFFLCYDNMCNFARLKALNEELPPSFQGPYRTMWSRISKIIDGLHLRNHKQESCKINFNPELFNIKHPEIPNSNTMAAEQAFSWLTKYKKQLNAMTKENQVFFLHRLVSRRNDYNAFRLRKGEEPLACGPRNFRQRAGL